MKTLLPVFFMAVGDASPAQDFESLDKYAHCDGNAGHYMVYEENLKFAGSGSRTVLQAGQNAGLTQVDTVAIYGWTLSDYELINPIAWGADEVTFPVYPARTIHCSLSKADVEPYIEVLNGALDKLPPARGSTLWRGSKQSAAELGGVVTGGYSSTSLNFDEALRFATGVHGKSLWVIGSHTSGKDISKFSESLQEQEVLFPAGSILEIVQCSPSLFNSHEQQAINSAMSELQRKGRELDIICMQERTAASNITAV